ncbi:unnamed protein product [Lathyrus oleraceus]
MKEMVKESGAEILGGWSVMKSFGVLFCEVQEGVLGTTYDIGKFCWMFRQLVEVRIQVGRLREQLEFGWSWRFKVGSNSVKAVGILELDS